MGFLEWQTNKKKRGNKMKEKRCLKFTGYVYLPREGYTEKDYKKGLLYPRVGRVQLFDEFNNKKGNRMESFGDLTYMANLIEEEYLIRARKIYRQMKVKKDGIN